MNTYFAALCAAVSMIAVGFVAAQEKTAESSPGRIPGAATNPPSATFNRYVRTPWFADPTVRQQIPLNEHQHQELIHNYQRVWHRYNDGLSRLENTSQNKLTPEQRRQREGDLRSEFQKDYSQGLEGVLTDQAARQRYNQLDWQYRGFDAFTDPSVRKELNLTPEQQRAFSDYDNNSIRLLSNWRSNYPKDRDRVAKQFAESHKLARERIKATMTPEQKAKWNDMIGKPYDFHPDAYLLSEPTTNEPVTGVVR